MFANSDGWLLLGSVSEAEDGNAAEGRLRLLRLWTNDVGEIRGCYRCKMDIKKDVINKEGGSPMVESCLSRRRRWLFG